MIRLGDLYQDGDEVATLLSVHSIECYEHGMVGGARMVLDATGGPGLARATLTLCCPHCARTVDLLVVRRQRFPSDPPPNADLPQTPLPSRSTPP